MAPFIAILVTLLATLIILACLETRLSLEAEQAALQFFSGSREGAADSSSNRRQAGHGGRS
jgi:hypothetical protein